MTEILDAIDGAKYVEKTGPSTIAVWHGGHTVNFYTLTRAGTVNPTTSISVGDYDAGELTLEDVKEGIEAALRYPTEE